MHAPKWRIQYKYKKIIKRLNWVDGEKDDDLFNIRNSSSWFQIFEIIIKN